MDYCYGPDYEERHFDAALIPAEKVVIDTKKIKEQESLIEQKDSEIKALQDKITSMSATLTAEKEQHQESRSFVSEDISEFKTRKIYIDVDLKLMGWKFSGTDADVQEEYEVGDMNDVFGQKGYCDYVLFGRDGLPLAVIEAKRTSKDPNNGRKQAMLYADCLERKFGRRPMIFTSNGFETYFWDDQSGPQRKVSGFFSKNDLEKLMNRRQTRKKLSEIEIDDKITDRYYQKEAIRAVCTHFEQKFRRALLVMATGTGKTRTASSTTDVLSRGGFVTNILFLADRTALVKQARDDFHNYLPDMSLCNLCSNKDDKNARIVFSTYPTILNAIDKAKADGVPLFTPAHFDLIIIDEAHRSIFKKYRAIFDYFDALLLGLTATPKMDVDRNTYDFFEVENGVPTYAYDYETAVYTDHVLVPYYNYEVKTKFLEDGITYDELSEEDKQRYEDDFAEDELLPDFISSAALNKFVFNEKTVDTVLQDLMERGIKVEGGDRLGKTIIFAQNKRHAEYIIERFNKLYPQYNGTFAQRVVCDDSYSQTVIDDFKQPDKMPIIAVSVDMMDTGIDVPECVNLVFFKKVRSKTKFWQMIGRGTRLCKGLSCIDQIDGEYTDKRRFLIFDYCGNFEYFREKPNGFECTEVKSLTESIFCKQVRLIHGLQESAFAADDYQNFRNELAAVCCNGVRRLNYDIVSVRLQKQYVIKYQKMEAFKCLSETDKFELTKYIAPLITTDDKDEYAKRFDNFMYGAMLEHMEQMPRMKYIRKQIMQLMAALERKSTIPQVKEKLPLIKQVQSDEMWENISIPDMEHIRAELRDLMKFLINDDSKPIIFTNLTDPVIDKQEGQILDAAYDFEDYKAKVNHYILSHMDNPVIFKLNHNLPLMPADYAELERIFTKELGGADDYRREYGDTPFGLLIRKIAKLDHDSAMAAFSHFINDQSLDSKQIAFIHKIISHIENNGYIEDVKILMRPPFDKPTGFIKMFNAETRAALLKTIESIKENALIA